MLTLFFSPGACSMASHIGIEETGAPYVEQPTLLAKGEQKSDAYLKINPRGKVPALSVDPVTAARQQELVTSALVVGPLSGIFFAATSCDWQAA